MKYVLIDKKVWSLQPIFLCKDKVYRPLKTKVIRGVTMTKSVLGSFIVQFDITSDHGKETNKDVPTYNGKEVVVLQAECYPYEQTIRMLCELIYKE